MTPEQILFLAYLAALISVGAALFSIVITRRGSDATLKGDVHELAILVDRLAKAERRERMQRVRKGEKVGESGEALAIPPGGEALLPENTAPQVAPFDKAALRRQFLTQRPGGRL